MREFARVTKTARTSLGELSAYCVLLVLGIRTGTRKSNGHNDSLCLLAMSELTTISLLAFAKKEESA